MPIHLKSQVCRVCASEIQPGRFHSLPGEQGRPVDFVCIEHCPICVAEGATE